MTKCVSTDPVSWKTDQQLAECLAQSGGHGEGIGGPNRSLWSAEQIAALVELQRRCRPLVESILRKWGVRPVDRDLLCDQVLDALWRYPVNPTKTIRSWLAVNTRRKAISYARRRRPQALADCGVAVELAYENLEADHGTLTPDQQLIAREEASALDERLSDDLRTLSATERDVLQMYFFDDLPICEIANRRKETAKQVSAAKHRGLEKLRHRLMASQAN